MKIFIASLLCVIIPHSDADGFNASILEDKLISSPALFTVQRTFVVTLMENKTIVCTGVLISELHALSTATCILRMLDLGANGTIIEVTAGKNDMEREHYGRYIDVMDIHEDHIKFKEKNPSAKISPFDIGVIKVKSPFDLKKYASSAKFMKYDISVEEINDRITQIWGWNTGNNNPIVGKGVLNASPVWAMPNSYCEEQLMKEGITEPHPNLMCVLPVISSSVIFEKKDYGSPLVYSVSKITVGIVTHFEAANSPVFVIKTWAVADYIQRAVTLLGCE